MLEILKKSSFFIAAAVVIIIFLVFTKEEESAQLTNDIHELKTSENLLEQEPETSQQGSTAIIDVKGAIVNPGVYEIEIDLRINDVISMAGGFTSDADQSQVNLAQKVQDEMIIDVPKIGNVSEGSTADNTSNGKVKINYATQTEIETLSGIGPSKAQAIIQYREENGFFNTLEDLLQVSGIGQKTLENLQEEIQIP
ncbi:helix-hairpin-helix domain-containing protein [Oceanobacillus rekensis]|uniref:helix-hairpin-helix domain-containing protein n=1 Tax=Oceanobacillus rekensis TaxID=937927 RepID=UPI000B434784|nr:helix-hairpin-helix domain-containing protein [Oceanobacillus rekensis]